MLRNSGFTLLELSIVLVIIGLITGGVIAGTELIRQAELNSLISQQKQYLTAINTFKLKYDAVPGDMNNAIDYWGAAHATPSTCRTTQGTGTQTCDGDGNGVINLSSEWFRFWQHLANAELLPGEFTGVTDGSTSYSCTANNSPANSGTGTIFWVHWEGNKSGSGNGFWDGKWGHMMQVGGVDPDSTPGEKFLTAAEAYMIDKKADDGKPGLGNIVTRAHNQCANGANTGDTDVDYELSDDSIDCVLNWRNVF